jgi:hypothetical protein
MTINTYEIKKIDEVITSITSITNLTPSPTIASPTNLNLNLKRPKSKVAILVGIVVGSIVILVFIIFLTFK